MIMYISAGCSITVALTGAVLTTMALIDNEHRLRVEKLRPKDSVNRFQALKMAGKFIITLRSRKNQATPLEPHQPYLYVSSPMQKVYEQARRRSQVKILAMEPRTVNSEGLRDRIIELFQYRCKRKMKTFVLKVLLDTERVTSGSTSSLSSSTKRLLGSLSYQREKPGKEQHNRKDKRISFTQGLGKVLRGH